VCGVLENEITTFFAVILIEPCFQGPNTPIVTLFFCVVGIMHTTNGEDNSGFIIVLVGHKCVGLPFLIFVRFLDR